MLGCCPHCLLYVISCCEEPEPACGDVELTERNATALNLEFKFDVVRSGGVVVVPPVTTHTHNSLLSSISIHQQQPLRFYLSPSRAHTHTIHFIIVLSNIFCNVKFVRVMTPNYIRHLAQAR